jgi:hypothetical protein
MGKRPVVLGAAVALVALVVGAIGPAWGAARGQGQATDVHPRGLLQLPHAAAGREPDLLSYGVELEAIAVRAVPAGWAGLR